MIVGGSCFAQNPFITHMYTADPSAHVFNDTLYVYPSHDRNKQKVFDMRDWHVFSTTDMKNWTDHGVALRLKDLKWAKKNAWAPDCAKANGKYYFYYPTDQFHIGVAVSDKPTGPFVDPLSKPLISQDTKGVSCDKGAFIDPCVFIDDDNQAYLYMGQYVVNAIKLNDDMISYDGEVYHLEGTDDMFEASWMHKYKGMYYLSYVGINGEIKYCMSDNPLGPFEYKGVILEKMNSGTNHHSMVEYHGQWYMFYHNSDLYFRNNPKKEKVFGFGHPGSPHPFRRSICFDKLYYNEDGTIQQVIPTK
ncbi:family 43 glycosylhydrolase [Bacteroidota bacterium]